MSLHFIQRGGDVGARPIKRRDGTVRGYMPGGPGHAFPFGGLWFATAVWSDHPHELLYVGDDEAAAVAAAKRVNLECARRVARALGEILRRVDGG